MEEERRNALLMLCTPETETKIKQKQENAEIISIESNVIIIIHMFLITNIYYI